MFPYGLRCSLDGETGYRLVGSARMGTEKQDRRSLCLEGPDGDVWVPIENAGRISLEDS